MSSELSLAEIKPLLQNLAEASLRLWDIPKDAQVRLINVSENMTYLIEAIGFKSVLRIHRAGYHSRAAIESELAWMAALAHGRVLQPPNVIPGKNGEKIQSGTSAGLDSSRFMVMFDFIDGTTPSEDGDLSDGFEELGALAAKCHTHAAHWARPDGFQRMSWDEDAVFGTTPTWGNWRDAPNVSSDIAKVLEAVEARICARLERFGKSTNRYNLIHADMRLANLLVGAEGTRLIDFDDCGFGWFLYDFAAAISFIEDDPQVPALRAAWLRGYRAHRTLSAEEEAEIDTFIMLRRMALLAWIGSHIEAPEPQALAPDFARRTAALGRAYLQMSLPE